MDICIVVVSYNSSKTIYNCLKSLFDNSPEKHSYSVVLVDNASIDDTLEIVMREFPEVQIISNSENLGFGKANNQAMNFVKANFYYLHNSDAYLQENILDKAIEFMQDNNDVGIVGFPLVYPDLSVQTSAYSRSKPFKWFLQGVKIDRVAKIIVSKVSHPFIINYLQRFSVSKSFVKSYNFAEGGFFEVDWVCGAAMLIKDRTRVDVGGGFDEHIFLYGEDEDICIEASERGWKVGQLMLCPVIHDFGWGQHKKSSKKVALLKWESLLYFINKRFERYSVSWFFMRLFLLIKKKSWGI